ncbi:MAG: GTPase HflX, partial [Candidatus Eremiobacteraeota bacterium]|nr:GTPase HflX [Candidatus Eremiobacteraeota bacterium]
MQRALVAAVATRRNAATIATEIEELEELAHAAGAEIAERIVQQRAGVDPATLVGSGKAREIATLAHDLHADLLLILNDLRPRQRKNLERLVPLP